MLTSHFGFHDLVTLKLGPGQWMSNLTFRLVSCTWGNKNEDPKSRRYEVIMLTNICTARPLASGDRYTPQPQWLRCRNETDDFYWKQWVIYMNIVSCIVWQNISSLEFCRQTIKTLCTAQWKYVSDEGLSSNNSGKLINLIMLINTGTMIICAK